MADIQSAAAEIRRGKEKKEERRRTNHNMKIYMVSLFHRATIKKKIEITARKYNSLPYYIGRPMNRSDGHG